MTHPTVDIPYHKRMAKKSYRGMYEGKFEQVNNSRREQMMVSTLLS